MKINKLKNRVKVRKGKGIPNSFRKHVKKQMSRVQVGGGTGRGGGVRTQYKKSLPAQARKKATTTLGVISNLKNPGGIDATKPPQKKLGDGIGGNRMESIGKGFLGKFLGMQR